MKNTMQNDPENINPENQKECVFTKAIPTLTKQQQRKLAKVALVTSMGLLTVTGFTKALPFSNKVHTLAGIALLGFSLWHVNLYKPAPSNKCCKTEDE